MQNLLTCNVPQSIKNTQTWPEGEYTEPLLTCTYGHKSIQLLTGVYAELFRHIYQGQTGNSKLDWDCFLLPNRQLIGEGGKRMGKVFLSYSAKCKGRDFLTQCRRLVYETHHHGECSTLQHEFGKRNLYPPARKSTDKNTLLGTFQELQKFQLKDWVDGKRPKLFGDGEEPSR
jgi:hypothetical protein